MSMIVMMNMCLIYKSPLILYFFIVFLKRAFPFRKCTIFSQGFFSLQFVLYKPESIIQTFLFRPNPSKEIFTKTGNGKTFTTERKS